jgi:HEPN domain-containing protein
MASRHEDWLGQAKRDLSLARHATDDGFHEWACFAAQQAAEKAVKALYQRLGAEVRGHSVVEMLEELPRDKSAPEELFENAQVLDQYYIGPRYPNSVPKGMPGDFYTRGQAEDAIAYAQPIIAFCEDHILPQGKGA